MAKTRTNQPVYGIESNNLISGVQTQYVGTSGYKYHLVEFGGVMFFHFSFTSSDFIPANTTLLTMPKANHVHRVYAYASEGIKSLQLGADGKLKTLDNVANGQSVDVEFFYSLG